MKFFKVLPKGNKILAKTGQNMLGLDLETLEVLIAFKGVRKEGESYELTLTPSEVLAMAEWVLARLNNDDLNEVARMKKALKLNRKRVLK